MSCRNLRPSPSPSEGLEGLLQRQRDLRGVPAAREARGHGLTPADLGTETVEAERPGPVRLRIVFVAEPVPRLAGPAAGAQDGLLPYPAPYRRPRHGRPFLIKSELSRHLSSRSG